MATVTSVTMHPPVDAAGDTVQVKVDYTVQFAPEELGLAHRVRVELWARDARGEQPFGLRALYEAPLHTFRFGVPLGVKRTWKGLTPQSATVTDTVSDTLPNTRLDEDPGWDGFAPNFDEVYARVTVAREFSADSPVVHFSADPLITF